MNIGRGLTMGVDHSGEGDHFTTVNDTVEWPGRGLAGRSYVANPSPLDDQGAILDYLILIVYGYHQGMFDEQSHYSLSFFTQGKVADNSLVCQRTAVSSPKNIASKEVEGGGRLEA